MINLDMVGRLREEKLNVGGIGTASEWKNLIESINGLPMNNLSIDVTTKTIVENEYKRSGLNAVLVEATTDEITLRGTVPKGRMAEVVRMAHEIGKRKVNNQLTESDNLKLRYEEIVTTTPFALTLNEDGFGPSDHSSFYAQKIPVLFFFTGTHSEYHKPTDTAEKINYQGLLKITNYVSEIVKAVDVNPTKPKYAVAKSSGMTGGRTGFNVSLGTVPSYAESTDGMTIDAVRDASPAQKAGLKAGDKIVRLAGKEIRNVYDYTFVLGELKAGVEYEVEVARGTEKLTFKIVPAAVAASR